MRSSSLHAKIPLPRAVVSSAIAAGITAASAIAQIVPITPIPTVRAEARHVVERTSFGITSDQLWGIASEAALDNYIRTQLAAPGTGYGGMAETLIKDANYLGEGNGLDYTTPTWGRNELRAKQVILALESPYQLREVMTWFWEQHFSTYINQVKGVLGVGFDGPNGVDAEEAAVYHEWFENQRFRELALTDFASLLRASLDSPAMRYYLHLVDSGCRNANEDYPREVLELHTVNPFTFIGGVQVANYTTLDIQVISEVFRGLNVNEMTGQPIFDRLPASHSLYPNWLCHWPVPAIGAPLIMRDLFDGSSQLHINDWHWTSGFDPTDWIASERDWHNELYANPVSTGLEGMLFNLVNQPETKRFVCTKLIHWFCGDADPVVNGALAPDLEALLTNCVSVWGTNGDMQAVLSTILFSDVFRDSRRFEHLRNPLEMVIAQARILDARLSSANTADKAALLNRVKSLLSAMDATGATPHEHPAPDGFPLRSLRQPGSAVYWQQGAYASLIYTDYVTGTGSTVPDNNLPYDDVVDVLQDEVARLGYDWTNAGQVARAALRLFYENRWSGRDRTNARSFLDLGGPWSAIANNTSVAEPRVRQMTAFLRALPQAMEK